MAVYIYFIKVMLLTFPLLLGIHIKGCHTTGKEVQPLESENLSCVCLCSVSCHHPECESLHL